MNALKGKVALVTGSGQGIGKGIAMYFAMEGAIVITNNRKPLKNVELPKELSAQEQAAWLSMVGDAETTAKAIRAFGGQAEAMFCDVANDDAVSQMIGRIVEKYGRIDIVVNNAAITESGALLSLTERDYDRQTSVKMKGTFNCCRHAAPYMIRQGGGTHLNCASDAWVGLGNAAVYSAANAGIVGMTKAMAMELWRHGINCNAFCPQGASPGHVAGFARTLRTLSEAMGREVTMSAEKKAEIDANHADSEGLAPFLAYLCTDQGKRYTAQVFSVTASGKVDVYSAPVRLREITKPEALWTVEELAACVPDQLMQDYQNPAESRQY